MRGANSITEGRESPRGARPGRYRGRLVLQDNT
jgi:hypothetical protein